MTTIDVKLSLTGNFDPNELTQRLGILPTKIWRLGDQVSGASMTWKHDGWCLSAGEIESLDLGDAINRVLKQVLPISDKFRKMCDELAIEPEISCSVYVEESQYPSMFLSKILLKDVGLLNANIDIDIL